MSSVALVPRPSSIAAGRANDLTGGLIKATLHFFGDEFLQFGREGHIHARQNKE